MFVYVSPNVLIYEQLYHCYYMQYQQSIVFKNTYRVTLTCVLHMMTLEFTVIGINGLRRSHHHTITVGYSNKPLAYYHFWISTKFGYFDFNETGFIRKKGNLLFAWKIRITVGYSNKQQISRKIQKIKIKGRVLMCFTYHFITLCLDVLNSF